MSKIINEHTILLTTTKIRPKYKHRNNGKFLIIGIMFLFILYLLTKK